MQINLTPEEIIDVSGQLSAKAEEISNATSAADTQVGRIRDMMSPRLQRDVETWDQLKSSIQQAINALRDASEELKRLGEANITANQ